MKKWICILLLSSAAYGQVTILDQPVIPPSSLSTPKNVYAIVDDTNVSPATTNKVSLDDIAALSSLALAPTAPATLTGDEPFILYINSASAANEITIPASANHLIFNVSTIGENLVLNGQGIGTPTVTLAPGERCTVFYSTADNAHFLRKQTTPTVDAAMSDVSANAVRNSVIKAYVDAAVAGVGTTVDAVVTSGSANPVQSSGIYDFVNNRSLIREYDIVVEGAGNATADDTAIGNAVTALNAQGYGTLWLAGTIRTQVLHRFSAPISLRGVDGNTLVIVENETSAFQWAPLAPSAGTYWDPFTTGAISGSPVGTALDSSLARGDGRFATSGQSFTRGDWVLLWSDDDIPDLTPHYGTTGTDPSNHPMEMHRVAEVSGSLCTIDGIVVDAMTTANGAKVRRMPMLLKPGSYRSDIVISDLNFQQSSSAFHDGTLLWIQQANGVEITRCRWEEAPTVGGPGSIFLQYVANVNIHDLTMDSRDGFISGGIGYGIVVAVCNDVHIHDSRFLKTRHCLTTGSSKYNDPTGERWGTPRNIVFSDNYVFVRGISSPSTGALAVDCHAEGYGLVVEGCTFEMSDDTLTSTTNESGAIHCRARSCIVKNNTFIGSYLSKAVFNSATGTIVEGNTLIGPWRLFHHDTESVWPQGHNRCVISGNQWNGGFGVSTEVITIENGEGHVISNNTFSNLRNAAIRLRNQGGVATDNIRNLQITGNTFTGSADTAGSIGVIYCDDDVDKMLLAGNTFSQCKTSALQQAGEGNDWHIIGNTIREVGQFNHGTWRYPLRIRKGTGHRIINNEISAYSTNNNSIFVGTNGTNAATVDSATDDDIQVIGNTLQIDSAVIFGGTALPGNINANQIYYVITDNGDFFQVSETRGGGFVNMSSNGTNVTVTEVPEITIAGNTALGYGASSLGMGGDAASILNAQWAGSNWTD